MVGYTTTTNLCFIFETFIWIEFPVVTVTDTYSINVSIESDKSFTSTHVTKNVTHWVYFNFVKAKIFHFFFNALNVFFFFCTFTRECYDFT